MTGYLFSKASHRGKGRPKSHTSETNFRDRKLQQKDKVLTTLLGKKKAPFEQHQLHDCGLALGFALEIISQKQYYAGLDYIYLTKKAHKSMGISGGVRAVPLDKLFTDTRRPHELCYGYENRHFEQKWLAVVEKLLQKRYGGATYKSILDSIIRDKQAILGYPKAVIQDVFDSL